MSEKICTRLIVDNAGESILTCSNQEILAISKILRLSPGDWAACFNGDGMEYIYSIKTVTRTSITLQLHQAYPNPLDKDCEFQVFIAATKGKTRDRMVRDLPPLGVAQICFYQAERSVAKLETDQQDRLQKIAAEACRQCGRSSIPKVIICGQTLLQLSQSVFTPQKSLLFWENDEGQFLHSWGDRPKPQHLIFGPEGGLSPEEIRTLRQKGIVSSSLGKRILRSELAVVVGTTLVGYHFSNPNS